MASRMDVTVKIIKALANAPAVAISKLISEAESDEEKQQIKEIATDFGIKLD